MDTNSSGSVPQGQLEETVFAHNDWKGAEHFLTPQQRLQAVGEILATIALRSLQQERSHGSSENKHENG